MSVRIINADVMAGLAQLQDGCAQICVTSPPYFGLRDYGMPGQIGLETTPEEYIAKLVAVFREVRRVLKDDGTLWINMGDSYAGSWGAQSKRDVPGEISRNSVRNQPKRARDRVSTRESGLKPKDLIGIPWMLAFALRADGWYLRQEIIWHKVNPMPESVNDRCTKAHEQVFLLSKSPRYYFDQEAILEPVSENTHPRVSQDVLAQAGSDRANGGTRKARPMKAVVRKAPSNWDTTKGEGGHGTIHRTGRATPGKKHAPAGNRVKNNPSFAAATPYLVAKRNKRSVWSIVTEGFKEAHFATFPTKLVEPCILAGSRKDDLVLDPFGGAGTTGLVADRHQRDAVLIEINPEYAAMAKRRIYGDAPLLTEVA